MGEIELFTVIEAMKPQWSSLVKVFTFLWKKQDVKNNETQRNSEHEIAFPAKGRECTYDLIAFSRRDGIGLH